MRKRGTINAILTADWHLGAIDPVEFEKELDSCLTKKLNELWDSGETLDYLFIAGDLFDSKQYFSSDAVIVAIRIFDTLYNFANQLDTKIIIIQGTRTHDADQLSPMAEIFRVMDRYNWEEERFYIFNTVSEFVDQNDSGIPFRALMIPEEYVADQSSYYESYLSNHYDFIVGHGMIDKIWYAKSEKENYGATQIMSAPVFELDDLVKCGEYSFFGHVHTHKFYAKNKFRYLGPVTRWKFGEATCPLGVTYVEYDLATKELVCDEFIENELAPLLPTRIINLMNYDQCELSQVSDEVDSILAEEIANGASRIKFVVNLNSKLENISAIKDFLITKIGNIPIAKLVISSDFDKDVVNTMKESLESEKKSLDYVFNRNLDIEYKIKEFIKTHNDKDISIDQIQEYLKEE